MAIQFRRGEESDLVAENLLAGEPAYCTDTLKLVIGHGDGGVDYIDSRTETLWSGTAIAPAGTATLSDDLYNYRFVALKPDNGVNYLVAPVIPGSQYIRSTGSWVNDTSDAIQLYSARGTYNQSTRAFTLDKLLALTLSVSGTTISTSFTGITEIRGIR
jgi:hypothetical protein